MAILTYQNVYLAYAASVAGKLESEGPLGTLFDATEEDAYYGKDSWEQAESEMVRRTLNILMGKAALCEKDIELLIGGDLLDQCTATGFAALAVPAPFLGLYGACSTAAEALMIAGLFVDSGFFKNAVAVASSHFCSSERQFRFPLEYGNQRPPVSQTTVTGSGAFLLQSAPSDVRLNLAMAGRVMDAGITDANNMGAAMAGAAVDTIARFFAESGENPGDYDIIATGDLGKEGYELASELFSRRGVNLCGKFTDCGMLIYDYNNQDVQSGGSGCGCSALTMAALFMDKLKRREIKKLLLIGTGALLSPKTALQKLSIPAVAHLVGFERV